MACSGSYKSSGFTSGLSSLFVAGGGSVHGGVVRPVVLGGAVDITGWLDQDCEGSAGSYVKNLYIHKVWKGFLLSEKK